MLFLNEIVKSILLFEPPDLLNSDEIVSLLPSYLFEWEFILYLVAFFVLFRLI